LIDIFNLNQWDEIIAPNLPAVEPVLEACLRRLCHDTGYRINLERGELQFDFINAIVPVAADAVVELCDGINEIAF
jgi:hypothetical protein